MRLQVLVSKKEQLSPALGSACSEILIESTLCEADGYGTAAERIHSAGKKAYLALPWIFREEMRAFLEKSLEDIRSAGFDGYLVRTLGELAWLDEKALPGERISDHSLYAMNCETAEFLRECGFSRLTAPLELSSPEIRDLDFSGDSVLLYGHLPMMFSANCLLRTAAGCDKKSRRLTLVDRMGNRMIAECVCRYCMNRILNAVPLSLLSLSGEVRKLGIPAGRLDFTVENAEETKALLSAFEAAYISGEEMKETTAFTRGHFHRKVD